MASNSFKVKNSLNIIPNPSPGQEVGDIRVDPQDSNKLKYHDGVSEKRLIKSDQLADLNYDNSNSGLAATNPQEAIDEVQSNIVQTQSDLTDLQNEVNTKANQSDLELLESEVATKANQSDLESLEGVVNTKADESDLISLSST